MDRFTIEVKRSDVEPLIRNLDDLKDKIPFNQEGARYFLYKNPPKDKSLAGERHIARLSVLKKFNPLGFEDLIRLLTSLDSPPVVKVKQPSQKPFIVKTTHSQSSLKFEAHLSELLSQINVGPKFIAGKYLNSRAYCMVEEYVSNDTGFQPIHEYRTTKFALRNLPHLFGSLIGRMHSLHSWETSDGISYEGHVWYKERFLNHLWLRSSDDSLRLVDFGEVRLVKPEVTKEGTDLSYKEKLSYEATRAAQNLVFGIAYPFVYGISKTHDGMRHYEGMLEDFCNAYNKETGFDERIRVSDIVNIKPFKGSIN